MQDETYNGVGILACSDGEAGSDATLGSIGHFHQAKTGEFSVYIKFGLHQ